MQSLDEYIIMVSNGCATQMKAIDEHILTVLLVLYRVHFAICVSF